MARMPAAEEAGVYRAAALFVDRCLRADDSLFTPGSPVWSAAVIEDLHRCFVLRPDYSETKWDEKFPKQLANASSPLTVQLAGEGLYMHFLFARDIGGAKKREIIGAALACTPQPVQLPADLAQILDSGITRTGTAFGVGRPQYLAYLVEFARHWKTLPPEERAAALADPWQFKKVAFAVEAPGAPGQREGLLHLVFPDRFESMLSGPHKTAIVAAFPEAPGEAADVDQRLAEIRDHLTPPSGEFINFYAPELQSRWRKGEPMEDEPLETASQTVWWVNQGSTYAKERRGGFLWAPKRNKAGNPEHHWDTMQLVERGDVVVHYANAAIKSLSVVTAAAVDAPMPEGLGEEWEKDGWLIGVTMRDLPAAVPLADLPAPAHPFGVGPFTSVGGVKQGYLWEVPTELAAALAAYFAESWPTEIPPERPLPPPREEEDGMHEIYAHIAGEGFAFPEWLITDYLLALATKPFVLLSGISGTGKTKLAQLIAEYLAPQTEVQSTVAPELELDEDEFVLKLTAASLRHRGYIIPVAVAQYFTVPEPGSGYDVAVTLGEQAAGVHVNNIAYDKAGNSTGLALTFRRDFSAWLEHEGAKAGDRVRVRIEEGEPMRLALSLAPGAPSQAVKESARTAFISVRADWTDGRAMLGYYNPLTESYVATELLRLLLHAAAHPGEAHFVILDEMNLAKVEYYFSDFLSAMESGTAIVLHDAGENVTAEVGGHRLLIPERVHVPANLLFTGTVNVDETTFMFSPKVLDRANVIQFHAVDLVGYRSGTAGAASTDGFVLPAATELETLLRPLPARRDDYLALDSQSTACLETVNGLLAVHHLHFGYRVANEIARYLRLVREQLGDEAVPRALDLQIQQKILPKFVGNRAKLEAPLWALLSYLKTGRLDGPPLTAATLAAAASDGAAYPESVAALARMLATLRQVGFASFIE